MPELYDVLNIPGSLFPLPSPSSLPAFHSPEPPPGHEIAAAAPAITSPSLVAQRRKWEVQVGSMPPSKCGIFLETTLSCLSHVSAKILVT